VRSTNRRGVLRSATHRNPTIDTPPVPRSDQPPSPRTPHRLDARIRRLAWLTTLLPLAILGSCHSTFYYGWLTATPQADNGPYSELASLFLLLFLLLTIFEFVCLGILFSAIATRANDRNNP